MDVQMDGRLLQLVRQIFDAVFPVDAADGLQLLLGGGHGLVRVGGSQFTLRLMVLRMSFSTLALMTSMAEPEAPMVVRKSSMASDCLKYTSELPERWASLGEKPMSSRME
jgi:hypothetical protein